jgi:hypothetical protein
MQHDYDSSDVVDPRPQSPPVESDEQSQRCAHQRRDDRPFDPVCFDCDLDAVCARLDAEQPTNGDDGWRGIADALELSLGLDPEDVLHCLTAYPNVVLGILRDLPDAARYRHQSPGVRKGILAALGAIDAMLVEHRRTRSGR